MIRTAVLALALAATPVSAASVTQLQVKVVTGGQELAAGSRVELRLYEAGKDVRRMSLTHGEAWPRDSTLVIPVTLSAPLDPRTVVRFGLYYQAASPLAPSWEVVSAEVDLPTSGGPPERLLDATLTGVISRQGELATVERDLGTLTCITDADCDDHRRCNGQERCAPDRAGADARGCVKGAPLVCPVNQVCIDERGCRGLDGGAPKADAAASQ